MKKLKLLILCLITGFISFGQTYTSNQNDRIVDFAMRQGMKDHISLQSFKEENNALKLSLSTKSKLNSKLQEFNLYLQDRNKDMTLRWNESMKQNDILSKQISDQQNSFNSTLKRERNKKTVHTIFGVGFGVAVGILIGTIFIK